MSIIITHGSVETSAEPIYLEGLRKSAKIGYDNLSKGRLQAIVRAVNELEDNPLFNAGLGSVLNRDGYVEVDGSLMDGETSRFTSVAAMSGIRYAITVAYKLFEETKLVCLAGKGATQFAREQGIPADPCIINEQLESWDKARKLLSAGKDLDVSAYTGLPKGCDTVGCVICDDEGRLAAGSSTGGSLFKPPGRVGDTPFIGGGIFASKDAAVVCTGRGEAFVQTMTAKFVDDQIKAGCHPQEAAEKAIRRLSDLTSETGGLIVVNNQQQFGLAHNCSSFPIAIMNNGQILKEHMPLRF
jgi:L-asparaginase / beta-aspartyl-peptidase